MNEAKKNMSFWQRFTGHLKTVHHHRALVRKYCFACGLYWQGLTHDLSKYSPTEFIPSVHYYQGWRSPYPVEKKEKGYSMGWLHHKGRNPHHWEYWYDTIDGVWQPVKMPYRYLIESICDRIAASRTYHKDAYQSSDALNYFLQHHGDQYMHPETAKKMEKILRMVAENGEEDTFWKIRQSLKEHREV